MNFRSSKRGQMGSYIAGIVLLFTFAILSLTSLLILNEINIKFSETDYYSSTAQDVMENYLGAITMMDFLMIFVVVALVIGIILTTYRLNTAPVFFIVSILMASFLGFIGYFFSYMFIQFASHPAYQTIIVAFPRTVLICSNAHWIGLLLFCIGSITLYAKREKGGVL